MLTRRKLLKSGAQLGTILTLPPALTCCAARARGIEVNDMQSRLNASRVDRIVTPQCVDEFAAALRTARKEHRAVSVAGGRHSMGGQQFGEDTILLDTTRFNRVSRFDREKGHVEVEAGIQWPELIDYLHDLQEGDSAPWTIREKQTGVDSVTLGGSVASNVHGRGLRHPPLVADIESFALMDATGSLHTCSRRENAELFALAIGGYGLFGIITHVTLRLVRRAKLQRIVNVIAVRDLIPWIDRRLQEGFVYGDCQYSTDLQTEAAAHPGVLSCYRPVPMDTPMPDQRRQLSGTDWMELYRLARTDKKKAFERYSQYYLSTSGQIYWSDTHQLAGSFDAYRQAVDERRGTEMITEVFVSRDALVPLLSEARRDFVTHGVDMTYGTIRFIEKDSETFLPWARESFVCIVCNLHVVHTRAGKRKAIEDFRRIIDRVIQFGGSYYLTYHRFATRRQVETCYPKFVEFLRLKRKHDPDERFQSDWYRHYREMFKDCL